MRLGGPYYDPFTIPKITSRQRWTPTPAQLHILENLLEQGIGTPSKAKIKEITLELSQHGQISEGNVYNWFQNRRARSKRRQGVESEVDTDFESSNKMKAKLEKAHSHDELPLTTGHLSLHGTETSSEAHYINQETKHKELNSWWERWKFLRALLAFALEKATTWKDDILFKFDTDKLRSILKKQ